METLVQDLRYAVRSLIKNPGFFAIAVLTLALGIGANTAMFTAVNAVLLRPLAYPDAETLVLIEGRNPSKGMTRTSISVPDLVDWQSQNQSFEELAGFVTGDTFLATGDETERVRTAGVSEGFFRLMRVNPLQGRTLQTDDADEGSNPGVMLSYGLWQRRFGGDPNAIGSKVTLNGEPSAIVGVMPAGFDYPERSELWICVLLDAAAERRDNRYLGVVGRLKSGVSIQQAEADLDTINQRNAQSFNETNSGWTAGVTNLRERLVGAVRPSLLILTVAVAFVLLIACANVANLLLSRATARQKEIAVRTALGARRGQIIRQLLTESILLSIVGGLAGLGLSVWLTRFLISISPPNSPRFDEIQIDARVFAFIFAITILTGLAFGLVPALQTSRVDLNEGLKGTSRGSSAGQRQNRVGSVLIVSEIALSFMLLVGAGLLVKSFLRLRDVSPGFNPENVITMRVMPTTGKFDGPARAQLFKQVTEKIQSVPGVVSAGGVLSLPLGGDSFNVDRAYVKEGQPATPEGESGADYLPITPDYFRAMQIPLSAGRAFTDHDTDQSPKVLIINQAMARRAWPGENPIGKRLTIWRDEKFSREVVGVVGNTRKTLDADSTQQMYVPYAQDPIWGSLTFVVRTTSADPAALAPALRNEIRTIDTGLAAYNVKTLEEVVATDVAPRRSSMLLFGAFAIVAVLLSMIGIYGVTAYYVTHRTHEIGIRMALGAQIRDVLALVLKRGVVLAGIGIAVGVAGAFALTRLMTTMLFGVEPVDVLTFVFVSLAVIAVAVIACYIPARRATRVDPLVALRYE